MVFCLLDFLFRKHTLVTKLILESSKIILDNFDITKNVGVQEEISLTELSKQANSIHRRSLIMNEIKMSQTQSYFV